MESKRIRAFFLSIALTLLSCSKPLELNEKGNGVEAATPEVADLLVRNANVITMNEGQPRAEAIAIRDGRISFVGSNEAAALHAGPSTGVIDAKDVTVIPGLIDGHSHFAFALQMVDWANVSAPPVGKASNIPALLDELSDFVQERKLDRGQWLVAWGYDETQLAERRHLTRDDLDPRFPKTPVILLHVSGHGAVLNSAALRAVGISARTKTPAGGVIARKKGSKEPSGLLMETAFTPVMEALPKPNEKQALARFKAAQMLYAKSGYTTVQEGASTRRDIELLREAAKQGLLFVDVVALPLLFDRAELDRKPAYEFGDYENRLRLGGVKIIMDGSPQGKTAYFGEPYLSGGPDGQAYWTGEPSMPYDSYFALCKAAEERDIRVFTHANGDAAIDMVIRAQEELGTDRKDDLRNVLVHSQFVRSDQLDRYVELGLVPSFFSSHTFFWGDAHVRNLGQERAHFASPLATAEKKGLRAANHTDFGVTPLDPMFLLFTAVTRRSRSGQVIGPDERVSAYQALKLMTLDAAYMYGEEEHKGSLEAGKLADLVFLSEDPLAVKPEQIPEIEVLTTYKEGRPIFMSAR